MSWDEYASGWDDQPGVRDYAQAAFDSLVVTAEARGVQIAGARACDFGCGTGLLTEHLVGLCGHIDAVDSSPAMIEMLRDKIERHHWSNVGVFEELPGSAVPYDLVVCASVCAFVDDYPGVVHQLASSMAPGGLFVQWDWELDIADDEPFGLIRKVIRDALEAAGLVSVHVDTAFELSVADQTMRPLIGVGQRPHTGRAAGGQPPPT